MKTTRTGRRRFRDPLRGRSPQMEGPFLLGQRARLPNGARIVVARTPGLHSAMIGLYVRVGSRHETPEANGASHFVEHLLFRGSRGYPDSRAMNAAVEAAGGSLNAMTARDHTCFYTSLHPAGLETGIDVLTDLLRHPLLRDVEVERRVILEEILDEVDGRGRDVDPDNLVKRIVFAGHGLGQKIAGTRATVRALGEPALRAHHARHYTGANVVLVAAGPVHYEEVVELAAPRLGALPRGRELADEAPPPWPEGPVIRTVEHDDAQVEFTLAFPAVPERHRDHAAALVVRRLLDDGLSSRLPFEVVERQGLAYSVHAGLETFEDAGIFAFEGACSPARLERVAGEIFRVAAALWEGIVPEEELSRVKERHRMSLTFALDNPPELVGWFGTGELQGVDETLEERCRRVEAVSAADVRRVARAMFRRRGLVAVAVGPDGRGMRRALSAAVDRSPLC
ncbi:MAG TPA: pitrilysin family protein [Anaeromyxobacteraceae bacterium]|nr:pitrilysin family protein [Anaeromyxobacteraceae bacterium]